MIQFEQKPLKTETPAVTVEKQEPTASAFPWQPSAEFILSMALIGDMIMVFAALRLGFWLRFESGLIPFFFEMRVLPIFFDYFYLLVMGTVFLLGTFAYLHLYSQRCFNRYLRTVRVIVKGTIFWLFAYLAVSLILKFDPPISRLFMLSSFVCVLSATLGWRLIFFKIIHWKLFASNLRQRVLFVGWGKEAEQLEREIRKDYRHPYEIVGCLLSTEGLRNPHPPSSVPVLGNFRDLGVFLEQRCTEIVILADLQTSMGEIIEMSNQCEMGFAQFKVIPSYFQILSSSLRLETISGVPVLGVSELPLDHFANRLIKRVIDIAGASVGLLVSIPLMATLAVLITRESSGPIFFAQERIGRKGRKFKLYRLRSMKLGAEMADHLNQSTLRNDPRLLRCGTFMRKWNLDEIPQFWNVLKGDMSLVGPRPERSFHSEMLSSQIPHYNVRYFSYPGITGWAQVNGLRGNTDLRERVNYDLYYLENWSLSLDFRIMILTLVRQKNAY